MSADNTVVIAKFPVRCEGGEAEQKFEYRVADLGFSGLPFEWHGEPGSPVRVLDVEYLVGAFARSQVHARYEDARRDADEKDGGMAEYGISSADFALPWADYEADVQARVAKRKGRPRRVPRRRRREANDHIEHLREFGKVIRYNPRGNVFMCCDTQVSIKLIGRLLAQALATKQTEIRLHFEQRSYGSSTSWSEGFSVEYIEAMLKWVAEHGWFWDEVRSDYRPHSDHAFDGNRITPGLHWAQVSRLNQMADELDARVAEHERLHETEVAASVRETAQKMRATAQQLLTASIPTYRRARRWR